MYELKKIGKVFTSKSVGTGPSSYGKMNLSGRGLTNVEKHLYKQPTRYHNNNLLEISISFTCFGR